MSAVVQHVWAETDMRVRTRWCRRFARAVASHQDALCDLMHDEVHKPRWQGLTADVMSLLAACRWHERYAPRVLASRGVLGRPLWMLGQSQRVLRAPLGTVGIIATWNYPVQLLGVQLVQALMAGNSVIVKPSERSARTQQLLLGLAVEAGLPDGTLRWLPATRDAGQSLLRDHHLDHLVFTGSTRVGRQIAAWAAERLVPTTLELSGCDTAIVLDDADPRLAAASIWNALVMNAGQTCMAPRRVLVERAIYRAFVDALSPLAAGAAPVQLIDEQAASHCAALAVAAAKLGGRAAIGVSEQSRGAWMRPTAVIDCPRDAALVRGEHFGPAMAVLPVRDANDAIAVHGACDQHLAASVYTRRPARAEALAARLRVGIVTINDTVMPVSHPGGSLAGTGQSGWGVTRGEAGLLAMTRPVFIANTSTRVRTPTGEPPAGALRKLAWFSRRVLGRAKREAPLPANLRPIGTLPDTSTIEPRSTGVHLASGGVPVSQERHGP